jgi:hypothetical protein
MNKCRALKCLAEIPEDKLFCPKHWKMIPEALKETVCDRVASFLDQRTKATTAQMTTALCSAIKQIALREGTVAKVKPSHPKIGGRTGE